MPDYTFTIPGRPVGWERTGINHKTGTIYTPKRTREYEERVGYTARMLGVEPQDWVAVHLYIVIPQTKNGRIPKRYPDIDNVLKSILDGLEGVAYINDRSVVESHCYVSFCPYNDEPRVIAKIEERDEPDHVTYIKTLDWYIDNIVGI